MATVSDSVTASEDAEHFASVLPSLIEAIGGADYGAAKEAKRRLESIVAYAGRPEAGPLRAAVADQLAQSLRAETPAAFRTVALYHLGLIGDGKHASAVAALLDDEARANEALAALQRMPAADANRALLDRFEAATPATRLALLAALGHRPNRATAQRLIELGRDAQETDAQWALLEACARAGLPPNLVIRATPALCEGQGNRYARLAFVAADRLIQTGENEKAEAVLTKLIANPLPPYLIATALHGLAEIRSEQFLRNAMAYLRHPQGLHESVFDSIASARIKGINSTLTKFFPNAEPPMQADILRLLAARRAEGLEALLEEARDRPDPELRAVAYALSDSLPPLETLEALVPPRGYQAQLFAECVALARGKLSGASGAEARALLEWIAAGDLSPELRAQAAKALGREAASE